MNQHLKPLMIGMLAFTMGFQIKGMIAKKGRTDARVTSIGGIFFKCKNPKELKNWYRDNLGISINEYGAVFEWKQVLDSTQKGFTQWSPFNEKTKYFEPSTKEFMINYRVQHLNELLIKLRQNKVTIIDTVAHYDYGNFVHIMDLENNKIELWEPNDLAYEKMGLQLKCETNK